MRPIGKTGEGRKADDWRIMMRKEKGEKEIVNLDLGRIFI